MIVKGFPGGSVVKNPPAGAGEAGDTGLIPGFGRSPGGGNWQPTPVLPGESHGQRSLASYSPWGCKESDTTLHMMIKQNAQSQSQLFIFLNVLT